MERRPREIIKSRVTDLIEDGQPQAQVKNTHVNAGDTRDEGSIPGSGRSSGVGNGTNSSSLSWGIPWTDSDMTQ